MRSLVRLVFQAAEKNYTFDCDIRVSTAEMSSAVALTVPGRPGREYFLSLALVCPSHLACNAMP